MPWITVTLKSIRRYFEYVWGGLKARWISRNTTGIFGLISGFFKTFIEAFVLTRIDIKQGYI